MHQAATEPLRSLYFDYQVYPAAPCPASAQKARVVVAGAGLIGRATALALAKLGVPCVLLEAEQQVCEGSRAIVFTRRTLEILQQIGADKAVTASGLPWRHGNSFYRGQRVFRMDAPHSGNERFFPMTNLQQQFLEQTLHDLVQAQPLIEMRWGHKVIRVANAGLEGSAAQLEIDTPQGSYLQAADHVVACDGARSALRSLLGLKLEGSSYEGRFVIADIRIQLPLPTERLAFFDPVWNPGNTVLMHRQPLDMWRVDYQLPPDETPEQALSHESLTARINAQLAMIGHGGTAWELDWSSVYSARALTLPDYRHGRVLFAGDAAHLLPIFGVRGANTGFQDAQNLAWKLAAVVKGQSAPGLLDSYSHERVAAAREIVQEAGKSTRFMTPPTRGFRLVRDAVLSLSLTQEFVRPLYHWRTSRPHVYTDSSLNSSDDDNAMFQAGPAHGEPMANVALGLDKFLMDDFPAGFLLLLFGAADSLTTPALAGILQAAQGIRARGVPLAVTLVCPGAPGHAQATPFRPAVGHLVHEVHDLDGRIALTYGVSGHGGAYLFRPDQHVCARWQSLNTPQLELAITQALGQPVPARSIP
jgi:3-(3-hydroxy-phenyl)propionate hydroxylase